MNPRILSMVAVVGALTVSLSGCYDDMQAGNSSAPAPTTETSNAAPAVNPSGPTATVRTGDATGPAMGRPAGGALAGSKRAAERTVDKLEDRNRQIGEEADKLSGGDDDE